MVLRSQRIRANSTCVGPRRNALTVISVFPTVSIVRALVCVDERGRRRRDVKSSTGGVQGLMSSVQRSPLFTPVQLGRLTVRNRIVLAPMTRSRALPGGVPHPSATLYYAQRASGGLLISEGTCVSPQGVGHPGVPGIWNDEQVRGLATDHARCPRARRLHRRPALAHRPGVPSVGSGGRGDACRPLAHRRERNDVHGGGTGALRRPAGTRDVGGARRRRAVRPRCRERRARRL